MHLQQTKRESAASGGPQYFFHNLTDPIRSYLRQKGSVQVALVTPYGATKSNFMAVSKDHKLDEKLRPVPGKVGHDRIQQGAASESIGEAIRKWYHLQNHQFERIDVEVEIIDSAFYIRPTRCKYAQSTRVIEVSWADRPLTLSHGYRSPLWKKHFRHLVTQNKDLSLWSIREIARIVRDHRPGSRLPHIQETDLLRASGPLAHLGIKLGGYVGKGYDCDTTFQFLKFPEYRVPIEIKRNSRGFTYQQEKYGKDLLSRAVVLCAIHDHSGLNRNIDVIELDAFRDFAAKDMDLSV